MLTLVLACTAALEGCGPSACELSWMDDCERLHELAAFMEACEAHTEMQGGTCHRVFWITYGCTSDSEGCADLAIGKCASVTGSIWECESMGSTIDPDPDDEDDLSGLLFD